MGQAACRSPRPGRSWVPRDLDSSDSSLRSDDEDSILGLLAAPPPRSTRRLPRPRGWGVVSSTVSLPRALPQDSLPGVVSSDSVSVSLVGPVGLAPVQLVELSPLVHFEPRGIVFQPERILCLRTVKMGVRQVVPPVQESGIRPGLVRRAVWAHVNPAASHLVHIFVVLLHVLSLHSTPALGARHLLPQVTSSSGHPSGFGMGWLSYWQFVRLA